MNYQSTLQAVDTIKALSLLGIEAGQQGAYAHYPCHKCGEKAVIKAYGDKKNLYFCPKCKAAGQIIRLVMDLKNVTWDEAKELLDKAVAYPAGKITKELTINYEMEYDKYPEAKGIQATTADALGIGRPKGKTMLSGTVAFTVHDETNKKIAYYGIRIKDGKPVFHNSFNPELYLYGFNRIDQYEDVFFTTDMFDCVRLIQDGKQAVCNFGLPYLSNAHFALLNKCKALSFSYAIKNLDEIAVQAVKNLQTYFRIWRETSLAGSPQEK